MSRKPSKRSHYNSFSEEKQPLRPVIRMFRDMRRKASSDTQVILSPREFQNNQGVTNRNSSWELIQPSRMRRFRSRDSGILPLRPSCCIAGEHRYLQQTEEASAETSVSYRENQFLSESYNSSLIDITDLLDDEELIDTTMSLRCCQDRVLKQYNRLLILAAWRPFWKENFCCPYWFVRVLNVLYTMIVVLLMLFYTVVQVVTCQGKLSVSDATSPITMAPVTDAQPVTPNMSGISVMDITSPAMEMPSSKPMPPPCTHIISTYIIPALLHFLSYIFGFYLFRIQENEQLFSLMEKVFIQAKMSSGTHDKLIFKSRMLLFGSIIWVILHVGLDILYIVTYKDSSWCRFSICEGPFIFSSFDRNAAQYVVLVFKFLGLILIRMVAVAVILNYGVQCEMLVMYIQGLTQRLREKTVEIRKAMHEILGLRDFIGILNATLGKIASLCIVAFMELSVLGMCLLIINRDTRTIVWMYRAMFSALWIAALLFPLIQAARVYSWGKHFRQISFEMRVFGYQACSQSELDSFILFVQNATLRVKLFGVTIQPATLILTFGVTIFVLLLLFITDVITIAESDLLF